MNKNGITIFMLSPSFINKYIKTKLMYKESQKMAGFSIQVVLSKVWQKVAQKNIQKMVPTNVQKMNTYTFQSIAQLHSDLLQSSDNIDQEMEKGSLGYDNLLNSFIRIEKKSYRRSSTQSNQINNNSFVSNIRMKMGKAISKASHNSQSKNTTQRNKDLNPFKVLETEPEPDNKLSADRNANEDLSKKIDLLRDRLMYSEEMRKKQAEQIKIREKNNLEREEVLRKKKNQIDKFTYDYDGDFFGSKISNPQNTLGAAARIKPDYQQKQLPKNPKHKMQKIKPLLTTIVNQKIEQRHKRLATQAIENQKNIDMFKESIAARFANSFSQDDRLSEGISIKETTSNFTKFKPLNRIGEKLTLSEFKREAISKKFKQFRTKPIKIENHGNILKNKLTSYKSEQNFIENSKVTHKELTEPYNPSQLNKRYKTMFRSEQSSILSNSQLCKNSLQSTQKRGLIKISNPSLYKSVVHEDSFAV